jgi:diguanylate cyclase (GGDEF)-like protein
MAGAQTDVTDRRAHDPLTGLPNRALMTEKLEQALARHHRRAEDAFAVFFVDLDHFKAVNDTLGHAAGDVLLMEVARRLEGCLRPGDVVGRLAGDEFGVLLTGRRTSTRPYRSPSCRTPCASRRPGTTSDAPLASIGIASAPPATSRPELDPARGGRGHVPRQGEGRDGSDLDTAMRERLRRARLRRTQQRPAQRGAAAPVLALVALDDARLLEWKRCRAGSTRRLLTPDVLALAEQTGQLPRIKPGPCAGPAATRCWRERVGAPLPVAVNVSVRQFATPGSPTGAGDAAGRGLSPATCG